MEIKDIIAVLVMPVLTGCVWGYTATTFTSLPLLVIGLIGALLGVIVCAATYEVLGG